MLIADAKFVWYRLWSVRLALLSSLLGGLNVFMSFVLAVRPSLLVALLSSGVAAAAAFSRLVAQPKLHRDEEGRNG